jgi:hypothetical protein
MQECKVPGNQLQGDHLAHRSPANCQTGNLPKVSGFHAYVDVHSAADALRYDQLSTREVINDDLDWKWRLRPECPSKQEPPKWSR